MNRAAPGPAGRLVAPALLLAGLAAAWLGQQRLQFGNPRESGLWILAAGMAAVVAALLAPPRPTPADDRGLRVDWREILAVAALIGIGCAFRLLRFEQIPAGLNHDAAWYGLYAIYINQGAPFTPYSAAGFGRETLFMYLLAPLIRWLGNTPEALQLASTLCGIAALLPLYAVGRIMFGRRIAMIALGFLAVSGWHGVFSRAGWRVITVPPVEMLALYGAWRAGQLGGSGAALLTGAASALSLYTYNAGRIVPLLSGLAWVFAWAWRARGWRRGAAAALIAVAAFAAVALPMLWYASAHFDEFQRRIAAVADERMQEGGGWAANVWDAVRMFNDRANGDDFFVDEPLLEPLAGVAFLAGLVVALSRVPRREDAFVLAGLVLSLLPALASAPNGNRAITAIPFVYLVIAIGIDALVARLAVPLPAAWRATATAAAIVAAIAVAGVETYDQFLGPQRRPLRGASAGATGAALYLRDHAAGYAPAVISQWPDNVFLYLNHEGARSPFVIPWPFAETLEEIDGEIDRRGRQGLLFVLDYSPEADAALDELQQRYPEHRLEPIPAPRGGDHAVARALFIEPAVVSAPWRNFTRALSLRRAPGERPAEALRCGAALGDDAGVSVHVAIMLPRLGPPRRIGELVLRRDCADEDDALLVVAVQAEGLIAAGTSAAMLRPWTQLEAGRWYDVYVALRAPERTATIVVEGGPEPVTVSLPVDADLPVHVSGIAVRVDARGAAGGELYLDDFTVVGGVIGAADPFWADAGAPYRTTGGGIPPEVAPPVDPVMLLERFDELGPGSIAGEPGWDPVSGSVEVTAAPRAAPPSHGSDELEANAFAGSAGTGPAQFDEPVGVAIGPDGEFYVVERGGNRVQKFAADGTYLAGWGEAGGEPGQFREASDAVADEELLYVVDGGNRRVQAFTFDGTFRFAIDGGEDDPLGAPRGIDARHGNIYLVDAGRGIVRVFDRSGAQVATMGEGGGEEPGQLVEPVDVAVGAAGRVYVVNSGNNRIEMFRPDGSVDGAFPIVGWEGNEVKEGYLATDGEGVIYLSDPLGRRVRRFNTDGDELAALADDVDSPAGLESDAERVVFVLRRENTAREAAIPLPVAEPVVEDAGDHHGSDATPPAESEP